jgi:UDP-N-acetylglucosamine 4-epimerase
MTVLVTGHAGFIGSHLTDHLLSMGHKVIGVDNFSTGQPSNVQRVALKHPEKVGSQFVGYTFDITNTLHLNNVFYNHGDISVVFHEAALGSVPRSIESPDQTFYANVCGFNNILSACRSFGVKRLIYASSSSVYGGESAPSPKSPYAASKLMNEVQAQAYSRAYGLETIGLRYFNVFGPYQNPNGQYAAVIAKWAQAIKMGEPLPLHGDGQQARDFTYVDNVVDANIAASLALQPAVGQVFDIGCGQSVSLNGMLSEVMLHAQRLGYGGLEVASLPSRESDVRRSEADLKRARELLGYQPRIHWKEGVRLTCESALLAMA